MKRTAAILAFYLLFAGATGAFAMPERGKEASINVRARVVAERDIFVLSDCFRPEAPKECCVGKDCPGATFADESLAPVERFRVERQKLNPVRP